MTPEYKQSELYVGKDELYKRAAQLELTEGWRLGESLFEMNPDIFRLKADCAFLMREMPYKGNVVEFENGGEKWGFVRSTLATAIRYGLPYVAQVNDQRKSDNPVKFGTIVACVRPEDLLSSPVLGIREGVFAQADLEYASSVSSAQDYAKLNAQLIQESVNWLVSLGLPPEQIQVRINNFTEILFNVLSSDKSTVNPLLVKMAWEMLNEVDRNIFEQNLEGASRLKESAQALLQLSSDQGIIDKEQRRVVGGWITDGNYDPAALERFPKAEAALKTLEKIKNDTECRLEGTHIVVSPNSYRITPYAYSGFTFQIDAIGLNGTPIAEIAGGGDYSQTALNYWRAKYGEPEGNTCFTGIAFGLMRISTLLKK